MYKSIIYLNLLIFTFAIFPGISYSQRMVTEDLSTDANKVDKYKVVIEESFYVVKPENKTQFLELYRNKLYPFWMEMQKMGIIIGDYEMYSQRIHTIKPLWTYKTIVRFPSYSAIDIWLDIRDRVYRRLFPGEEGYKSVRKEIDLIVEDHWDEFIRQIPIEE